MSKKYLCYILNSEKKSFENHTYIGSTNDFNRRLRQHNGELKGGAKATQKLKPLIPIILIEGFDEDKKKALSYEWTLKHPNGKKRNIVYHGVEGRIKGLIYIITSDKWIHKFGNLNLNITITKKLYLDYKKIFDNIFDSLNIIDNQNSYSVIHTS
jgi:predicted GIY-YIG superfamily endonuclease